MNSSSQSKPFFVDTNVWLYAFIASQDPNKAAKARNIIRQSGLIISAQVINEICVNLLKKARFDEPSIQLLINSFYHKYRVGAFDQDLLLKSSELREKWQFSFWDSLIVSSALEVVSQSPRLKYLIEKSEFLGEIVIRLLHFRTRESARLELL
jgi:predicted nucleic acid-binding protein